MLVSVAVLFARDKQGIRSNSTIYVFPDGTPHFTSLGILEEAS